MKTSTQPTLPPTGTDVTVTAVGGYIASGRLIGLTMDSGSPQVRVLGRDQLERWVPAGGAQVSVDG